MATAGPNAMPLSTAGDDTFLNPPLLGNHGFGTFSVVLGVCLLKEHHHMYYSSPDTHLEAL